MRKINGHCITVMCALLMVLGGCGVTKQQAGKAMSSDTGLVFQSGFEGTSKVITDIDRSPGSITPGYLIDDIVGKDDNFKEKNDWVQDMDNNPNAGRFMLEYTGGDSTKRTARIIPEPGNPKNKVLAFTLKNSWEASEHQIKARIQADIYDIKPGYKEFYQTVRVFIPQDFVALRKYPGAINWLTISEFWNNEWWISTEKYGFRVTLGIGKPEGEHDLVFILDAQDQGPIEVWKAKADPVRVPIGKWFTMDYYFKEGDKDSGRFYMTITPDGEPKKVVFDVHDYTRNTHDPNPNGLTGYSPMKLYTSKEIVEFMRSQGKVLQIYWDDFKLWKNKRP